MKFRNPFSRRNVKYLSKEQQIKRSLVKGIGIGLLVTLIVIVMYQFLIIPKVKENEKIMVMNDLKKSESQNLYAVKPDKLEQGHIITESDLKPVRLPQELTPKDSIINESNLIGKVLRMNVSKNNILTKSIVTDTDDRLTDDLRKQDYDHIILNYNLKLGDYVDIRIRYKDGSDFRVATKKKILNLNGTKAVYQITEDEREFINNATVKAAINGGVLYTTIYKDPENQPPADVNYVLDDSIKDLIKSNPGVVKNAQDQLRGNVKPVQNNNSTNGQQSSNNTNTTSK